MAVMTATCRLEALVILREARRPKDLCRGERDSSRRFALLRMTNVAVFIIAFLGRRLIGADQVVLPTADDFSVPRIIERLAKRIEPDLVGKPERLPQYIDFFRNELGNDSRLIA